MKKFSVSMMIMMGCVFASGIAFAEIQSPIYTDEIGRSHFLGKGGYSTVRQINMQGMEASAVNDAINYHTDKMTKEVESVESEFAKDIEDTTREVQTDITNVIKEKQTVVVIDSAQKAETINRLLSVLPEGRTLTVKEIQILESIVEGKSRKEIAADNHVSENTIKTHISHVYEKFGVSSRESLMSFLNNRI